MTKSLYDSLRYWKSRLKGEQRLAVSPDGTPGCRLQKRILVGTHHKTGTKWFGAIMRSVSRQLRLSYYTGSAYGLPEDYDIFLQDHSRFGFDPDPAEFTGIHIIRDPRDVAVSGCFYHMKSSEEWLHKPREEFGGLTYQQKISSINSFDERLVFEMENAAGWAIRDMAEWKYDHPCFMEVKYEDLIVDTELLLFHRIFTHMGFPGWTMPLLLNTAWKNSIFSGRLNSHGHIRSGKKAQWREHFTPTHCDRFIELYGDVLQRLGYEEDDGWISSIR